MGLASAVGPLISDSPGMQSAAAALGVSGSLRSLSADLEAYNTAVELNDTRAQTSLSLAIAADVSGAGAGTSVLLALGTSLTPPVSGGFLGLAGILTVTNLGAQSIKTIYDTGNAIDDALKQLGDEIQKNFIDDSELAQGPFASSLLNWGVTAAKAAEGGNPVQLSADTDGPTLTLALALAPGSDGSSRQIIFDTQSGTATVVINGVPVVTTPDANQIAVSPQAVEISSFDIDGVLQSQRDVLDSGNQLLKLYDADNHKIAQEVDVDEDEEGNIAAVQVILDSPVVQAGGSIGEVFGSAIGRALAPNNQFAQLAAGTVVGAVGKTFGTFVAASADIDLSEVSVDQIFRNFGLNVSGAALGSIASFFAAEIGTALHLDGYGAQLFDAAVGSYAGSVLNQALQMSFNSAITAINWSTAFDQAGAGVGSALGSIIAHELVPAQTHTGAISGQILGAVGSAIGVALTIGEGLGFVLDAVIPGIGSLIGTVLGTVIGDVLAGDPHYPYAEDTINPGGTGYSTLRYYQDGGANPAVADSMAEAAGSMVNAYLSAVNGARMAFGEILHIGYQTDDPSTPYFWTDLEVQMLDDGTGHLVPTLAPLAHKSASAEDVVTAAGLSLLHYTEAVGGDILMKRAHQNSHYSDLITLSGDLQTAEDYERYLDNRTVINALIAAKMGGRDHAYHRFGRAVWQ
jgi:hypothetical protein